MVDSLVELSQNFFGIFLACQTIHNLKFGQLDVYRIVVLAEKHLDVILKHGWASLNDEQNIPKRYVLYFWPRRLQCHWRISQIKR